MTEEVTQEQKKKSTSNITIRFLYEKNEDVYPHVAGYQLLDNNLVIMTQDGPIYIVPMRNVEDVTITANKE